MSDTHEAVLGKIKALLRLAEDSRARGSLHEAEAAAARANEMVQKYRLDAATIEAAAEPERRAEGEKIGEEDFEMRARDIPWRSYLAHSIAREYGCKTLTTRRWISAQHRRVSVQTIIGRPSDVEIVRYMFAWLTLEIVKLADAYLLDEGWGRGKAGKNGFCLGATRGIGEALYKARQAAAATHAATSGPAAHAAGSMVLRSKEADLTAWMKRKYPHLGSGRAATVSDRSAFAAGHAAGSRLQTSHRAGLGAGGRKMLGGGS